MKPLPVPEFFDGSKAVQARRVDYQQLADEAGSWAARHQLPPASKDQKQVALMLVDCQNTFCLPDFELFVAGCSGRGAVEDNVRLCKFIYRNLSVITTIIPTLDTHAAMQIFHPVFWIDTDGNHPKARTIISIGDVKNGKWKVNPAMASNVAGRNHEWLQRHAEHYVRELTGRGKYPLMIWPYHAMLGGIGHALVSIVEEAVFFHCIARQSQPRFEIKGGNPLTEHYSVLYPEVREDHEGKPIARKESGFIQKLLEFDMLIIAGQAKSHCVAWTIDDLLSEVQARDPELVRKIYLLEDCTSPVVVPDGPDFTDQANEAFQRFSDAGMHAVKSTDPIESWPDVDL